VTDTDRRVHQNTSLPIGWSNKLTVRLIYWATLSGALRENEVLRAQVDRSAAALDASGDGSETSQALRRHADTVRRLHDDMRANLARYRSTERTLTKKVLSPLKHWPSWPHKEWPCMLDFKKWSKQLLQCQRPCLVAYTSKTVAMLATSRYMSRKATAELTLLATIFARVTLKSAF